MGGLLEVVAASLSLNESRLAAQNELSVAPCETGIASEVESSEKVRDEIDYREPHLLGRVAIADRHLIVLEALEVDGHAEGRADLVLAPVAPADRLGLVEFAHEMALKAVQDISRKSRESVLLGEGSTAT